MRQWYVVHTKPRKEAVAIDNLCRQGYATYCPRIVRALYRHKSWQQVTEPLFPRYLFVQMSVGIDDFVPIRSTTGVVGLVSFGNRPAIIPSQVIDAIQEQERCISAQGASHPNWKRGDRIQIVEGPFAGMNGIFDQENDEERVFILLDMLGRNNRISVDPNSIVPA